MKEIVRLGQLLGSAEQRDAVHVAVIPCVAGIELQPGDHVGVFMGKNGYIADPFVEAVGIVDPFLTHPVGPQHRFYVMLYPNTITSLRHEWTHPAIDGDAK